MCWKMGRPLLKSTLSTSHSNTNPNVVIIHATLPINTEDIIRDKLKKNASKAVRNNKACGLDNIPIEI